MDTPSRADTPPTSRSLRTLHLVRGLAALVWAAGFTATPAAAGGPLDRAAATLLVAYPLIDLAATLVDRRFPHSRSERRVLGANAVAGALAAVAVLVAALAGSAAVLATFGVWATLSGVAQVATALRRRGRRTGGQWPMLIAGGLSALVGVFYGVTAATSDTPALDPLVAYAAAGGGFFVAQAVASAWHERRAPAPQPRA